MPQDDNYFAVSRTSSSGRRPWRRLKKAAKTANDRRGPRRKQKQPPPGGRTGQRHTFKAVVWALALATSSLGTVLTASFTGMWSSIIPSPEALLCNVTTHFETRAGDGEYTVVVARIAGDESDRFGRALARRLRERTGLSVARTCRSITISPSGDRDEAGERAEEVGREILLSRNAEIMVWGEVLPGEETPRLWISHRIEDGTVGDPGTLVGTNEINNFIDDPFAFQLFSMASRYAWPNQYETAEGMKRIAKKIAHLEVARGPVYWEAMTSFRSATIKAELAHLLSDIAEAEKDGQLIRSALMLYRSAFNLIRLKPDEPLGVWQVDGAGIWRIYLAEALQRDVALNATVDHAELAVSIRQEMLREDQEFPTLNAASIPVSRSLLASAYETLASVKDRDNNMNNAVQHYEKALSEYLQLGLPFSNNPAKPELLGTFGGRLRSDDFLHIEDTEAFRALKRLGRDPASLLQEQHVSG